MDPKTERQIARINELSALARASWIGLLAYLAFVFITLLGVEDADFFVPSRQTQLPLVNVSIPTESFFYFAPILAAALYIYLHLFLLKLWDAIYEAPRQVDGRPLGDAIHPWLVNTLAISMIGGAARTKRPLDWLSNIVTGLLVWVAGPFVIGWAWWRSMPAHDEVLTSVIGFALLASLLACFVSWWRARARLNFFASDTWEGWWKWLGGTLIVVLVASLTWLRTEEGIDDLFPALDLEALPAPIEWAAGFLTLARTDLAGADLVPLPADWRSPETARKAFREDWCAREALDMAVCDHRSEADRPQPPHVAGARSAYCSENDIPAGAPCATHFAALDERFDIAWQEERSSDRANLPALDLSGRDLRRADLSFATLVGVDLRGARMEGARLRAARMEGADLGGARMAGADLNGARMEGADLSGARMEGARLFEARMEGAVLVGAHMEGARLFEAQMQGAVLDWAQMEGADLSGTRMEGADLRGARMEGGDLRLSDLRSAKWAGCQTGAPAHAADLRGAKGLTQTQLDAMVGDANTLLAETLDDGTVPSIPSCWATPPTFFEAMIARLSSGNEDWANELRAEFLCPEGTDPARTGTPLALDAPYPEGHPLTDRDN